MQDSKPPRLSKNNTVPDARIPSAIWQNGLRTNSPFGIKPSWTGFSIPKPCPITSNPNIQASWISSMYLDLWIKWRSGVVPQEHRNRPRFGRLGTTLRNLGISMRGKNKRKTGETGTTDRRMILSLKLDPIPIRNHDPLKRRPRFITHP